MKESDIKYTVALVGSGGLRADIEIGNVSMTDLLTTQPFGNTIDYFVAPVKVRIITTDLRLNISS